MGALNHFLSGGEKNSRLYIEWLFELFLSYEERNSRGPEGVLLDFFSFVEKICTSGVRKELFTRLLTIRASSASLLQRELRIPQASVYRELNNLIDLGLIERVLPRRDGVGRPYAIYAIKGYSPEDIITALEKECKMRMPAYSSVKRIKQLIIEEYLEPRGVAEISWRDIVSESRARCKGFYSWDIAVLVARDLNLEGVKVWR